MLTLDVLDYDCLISVFMFLDVENLTNVVAVNEERYLAAAKVVFKRKFQHENTILDSNSTRVTTNYIIRLNYFGDLITKLSITVPLPQTHQILQAIHVNCRQSLSEFLFLHDDNSSTDDDSNAIRLFIQHLDDFPHLVSLHCKYGKYGELNTNSGSFDRLDIRIPTVPSLKTLTIDGFVGCLEKNSKNLICSNPQIEEFSLWTGFENLYASYLKYIADKFLHLKTLNLRFAVYFPNEPITPLNFKCLETLKVVSFFSLAGNLLPFSGDTMDKLEDVEYICTKTSDQLIKIVSQFKQLKQLKIGSHGLVDEHLLCLARNLKKLEIFQISNLPSDDVTVLSFSANGIKAFLDTRKEFQLLSITIKETDYVENEELTTDIKEILYNTKWTVLEPNRMENRYVIIFEPSR